MSSTDAEDSGTAKAPSDGSALEENEELKKQEEERQLGIRMRHLKRRMVRAEQEAQDLQRRIDALKAKINKPIEPPRICPRADVPLPPPPLKRRRRVAADGWTEDPSALDRGGAGDATVHSRR